MAGAEVEIFTRFAGTVESIHDAFAFIMEHMDKVGEFPAIEVTPCWVDEEMREFQHYHVAVFGAVNAQPNHNRHG